MASVANRLIEIGKTGIALALGLSVMFFIVEYYSFAIYIIVTYVVASVLLLIGMIIKSS